MLSALNNRMGKKRYFSKVGLNRGSVLKQSTVVESELKIFEANNFICQMYTVKPPYSRQSL